jgi:hypothetical protein
MGGHGGKEAGVIMMCWAGMLTRTFARHGRKLELDVSNALAWHNRTKSPSGTKEGDAEGATTVKDPGY